MASSMNTLKESGTQISANPGRVLRLDVEDSAVAYEPGALVQLVNLTDLTLHDSNDITILAGEIAQLQKPR